MRTTAAALLFPVRPGAAAHALAGRFRVLWFPITTAVLAGAFFRLRGAGWADAAAVAAAMLALSVGLAVGGLLGTWPARLVLGKGFVWRAHLGGCVACATWTGPLFVFALAACHALGVGATAPLAAGFGVLIWGVFAGIGVIGGQELEDQGRALVASCLGLALALLGMLGALAVIQANLLLVWPAPVTDGPVAVGDVMLVRIEAGPPPGSLVLARNKQGTTVLARQGGDGEIAVLGLDSEGVSGPWKTVGRVFFAFGGWGGHFVPSAR